MQDPAPHASCPSNIEVDEVAHIKVERVEIILDHTRIEAKNWWGDVWVEMKSLIIACIRSLLICSDSFDGEVAVGWKVIVARGSQAEALCLCRSIGTF